MAETTNLHLKKPAYEDPADIKDINDNMDTLDTAVKANQDAITALQTGKINIPSGVAEGQFLQTDENGDPVWGDPADQATIISTTEGWLSDHVNTNEFAVDDTLLIAGDAADSKVTGEKISELKGALTAHEESISNDFEQVTGNKALVFKIGRYLPETASAIGTLVSYKTNANWVCAICPCVKGDVFNANVYGYTGTSRAWFICDSSMTCLSKADASVHLNGAFTINEDNAAYVVFNNYLSNMGSGYYAYKGEGLKTKLEPVMNTFNSRTSSDIVEDLIAFSTANDRINSGITYTKVDAWKWEISGTATAESFRNLLSDYPVVAGDLYRFIIKGGVGIRIYLRIQNVDQNTINYTEDGEYVLLMPDDIETMSFRFNIANGSSVDTTEEIHVLHYTPSGATDYGFPALSTVKKPLSGWKSGSFTAIAGDPTTTSKEIYKIFDLSKTPLFHVEAASGYKFLVYAWDGDTYKGTYRYGNFVKATGSQLLSEFYFMQMQQHQKAAIVVRKTNGNDMEAGDEENVIFTMMKSQNILYPTGDDTDRTDEVIDMLNTHGICNFANGQFYLRYVDMPEGSSIRGNGFGSEIVLIEDETSGENIWTVGDITFTKEYGYVFDTPLPPGIYQISCTAVSEDTDSQTCRVSMYYASPYVEANSYYKNIQRGSQQTFELVVKEPIVRIAFDAANTYSRGEGDEASFTDISIIRSEYAFSIGTRCSVSDLMISGSQTQYIRPSTDGRRNGIIFTGIGENTVNPNNSEVRNCYIRNFLGACILMQETGGKSNTSLTVSDCMLRYSYAGIAIPRYSEFNKVCNCTMHDNYYGILNNGGNNNFTGCDLVANAYGFAIDNADGNKVNNAHGGLNSCSIAHSTIDSIYINGSGSGFVFTGCTIDDAGAEIINSCRIIFSGCNFMKFFSLTVDGIFVNASTGDSSGLIIFSGSSFRDTFNTDNVHITDNNQVRCSGCYYTDGEVVDPYHPKSAT